MTGTASRRGENPIASSKSLRDICPVNHEKRELQKDIAKYRPDELTAEDYMKHLIGTPEEGI